MNDGWVCLLKFFILDFLCFLSLPIDTSQYKDKCVSHIKQLNADYDELFRIIKDLNSDVKPLRHGSIYLLSHLVDVDHSNAAER